MAEADEADIKLMNGIKFYLSHNLTTYDKLLARELGLSHADIANTERENQNDVVEFCYQLLIKWEHKGRKEATKEKLIDALRTIQRNDLANEVEFRCRKTETESEELVDGLRRGLKQIYRKINLPQLPWTKKILPLEQLFVEMKTVTMDEIGNEQDKELIKITEIFNPMSKVLPTRILVEGSPGFGKTTLALKILSDWSKDEPYIQHFGLVFMFSLRHFSKHESIEEALREECRALTVDDEKAVKWIKANDKRLLLFLDGYDEASKETKKKVECLFRKQTLPNACVVVTCRRALFGDGNASHKEDCGIARTLIRNSPCWDKRILIVGITNKNRKEFLTKYFEKILEKKNDKQLKHVSQLFEMTKMDLYECPLFLILLAFLAEDLNFNNVKSSKTYLYKFFFNTIFRKGLLREKKIEQRTKLDIFDPSPPEKTITHKRHFLKFGKLALKHLLQDEFTFDEEELLKCVDEETYFLNLGILTKCLTIVNHECNEFHQPIHKTFLEFSAAFYLFSLSNESDQTEFEQEIGKLVEKGIGSVYETLVFPFLGGFMNKKASLLLELLRPHAKKYHVGNSQAVRSIISEIDEIRELVPNVVPYVPAELNLRTLISEDADWIIHIVKLFCESSNELKKIKIIDK